jgi:hypothetical protein
VPLIRSRGRLHARVVREFLTVLQAVIPVFLVVIGGWLIRRVNWLTGEADASLLRVTVNVLMPCLVFDSILGSRAFAHAGQVLFAVGTGFATVLLGLLAALAVQRLVPARNPATRRTFAFSVAIYNYGYLPLPLAVALFDRETVAVLFVYNVGVEIGFWSFARQLAAVFEPAAADDCGDADAEWGGRGCVGAGGGSRCDAPGGAMCDPGGITVDWRDHGGSRPGIRVETGRTCDVPELRAAAGFVTAGFFVDGVLAAGGSGAAKGIGLAGGDAGGSVQHRDGAALRGGRRDCVAGGACHFAAWVDHDPSVAALWHSLVGALIGRVKKKGAPAENHRRTDLGFLSKMMPYRSAMG